jgi:hypothetical protein
MGFDLGGGQGTPEKLLQVGAIGFAWRIPLRSPRRRNGRGNCSRITSNGASLGLDAPAAPQNAVSDQHPIPTVPRIGKTLIAPIVRFVPEGDIDPKPTGHMVYPGTISVEPATFEALLTDICRSYKAHGFRDIILVGDSGGNQAGMDNVAKRLNARWAKEGVRVHQGAAR